MSPRRGDGGYLASLDKDAEEYVRAWAVFRPRIVRLGRNHPASGRAGGTARLQPRGSDAVFDDWRLAHAAFRLAG